MRQPEWGQALCSGFRWCPVHTPESEDEYSDDDDMSWKVRRAAAKCMAALIGSRPDLLPDFHRTLAPALIHRFKEREENVKADVFGAYVVLLRQTRPPRGWLEAMEEPTQTGSNLQMLRGQVSIPPPISHPCSGTHDSPSHLLTLPSFLHRLHCLSSPQMCVLSSHCVSGPVLGAEYSGERGPAPGPHRGGADRQHE